MTCLHIAAEVGGLMFNVFFSLFTNNIFPFGDVDFLPLENVKSDNIVLKAFNDATHMTEPRYVVLRLVITMLRFDNTLHPIATFSHCETAAVRCKELKFVYELPAGRPNGKFN